MTRRLSGFHAYSISKAERTTRIPVSQINITSVKRSIDWPFFDYKKHTKIHNVSIHLVHLRVVGITVVVATLQVPPWRSGDVWYLTAPEMFDLR